MTFPFRSVVRMSLRPFPPAAGDDTAGCRCNRLPRRRLLHPLEGLLDWRFGNRLVGRFLLALVHSITDLCCVLFDLGLFCFVDNTRAEGGPFPEPFSHTVNNVICGS